MCFLFIIAIIFNQYNLRYIYQHITSILGNYDGSLPLAHFLKQYYKQHPKLGSRDRKVLSEMTYCWYRCERGLRSTIALEQRVQACLAICNRSGKHLTPFLPTDETDIDFQLSGIFPHDVQLSAGIEKDEWLHSMLSQPDMFIRIRRNKEGIVNTLTQHNIPYKEISPTCFALPNSSNIDTLLPEEDYVVQDASSQQTGVYFTPQNGQIWWDCCSGAGGKSLLLADKHPAIHLTASDTRHSILHNLLQRYKKYKLPAPATIQLNMADDKEVAQQMKGRLFDGIICDVPCTGSGTWARTPEECYFFHTNKLTAINTLQKNIANNAIKHLALNGTLYYITCSVFRQENEDVVSHMLNTNSNITLLEMHTINGIQNHADSMFIALLKKK